VSESPRATEELPDRAAIRIPVVIGLLLILALEFVALVVVTIVLVVDLFAAHAYSEASGVALAILAAIAALWLAFMIVGLLRGQSWVRSGIVVWQFIMVALGIGAFEGVFRVPAIGWALLIPGVIALVLVFTPPATRLLARRDPPTE
jgi:hypothetical protein